MIRSEFQIRFTSQFERELHSQQMIGILDFAPLVEARQRGAGDVERVRQLRPHLLARSLLGVNWFQPAYAIVIPSVVVLVSVQHGMQVIHKVVHGAVVGSFVVVIVVVLVVTWRQMGGRQHFQMLGQAPELCHHAVVVTRRCQDVGDADGRRRGRGRKRVLGLRDGGRLQMIGLELERFDRQDFGAHRHRAHDLVLPHHRRRRRGCRRQVLLDGEAVQAAVVDDVVGQEVLNVVRAAFHASVGAMASAAGRQRDRPRAASLGVCGRRGNDMVLLVLELQVVTGLAVGVAAVSVAIMVAVRDDRALPVVAVGVAAVLVDVVIVVGVGVVVVLGAAG
mmetsp:Transcript_26153/g.72977  ORF Transcript_26153/g.72977 Transcript_26153/m.72977 type:complete len:335 (+) Transcript_26153:241-1245(+)